MMSLNSLAKLFAIIGSHVCVCVAENVFAISSMCDFTSEARMAFLSTKSLINWGSWSMECAAADVDIIISSTAAVAADLTAFSTAAHGSIGGVSRSADS